MSVYRWFSELVNEMVAANQWLDTEVLFRATAQANALYEFVFDKPAPGANTQAVQGHDHSTTQGGRTCARGTAYSGGAGQEQLFKFQAAGPTIWGNCDNANSSSKQRSTTFWAYCSGTSTGLSSPYTNPVAWCSLRFIFEPRARDKVISFRLQNNTLTKTSETQTFDSIVGSSTVVASASLTLKEVPIQQGWNEFTLELMSDLGTPRIYTTHICLMEAADEDGCYEASTGVSPLGGM